MKETTIIRIRRGTGPARYCACDDKGNPIMGFAKLSDIRKRWNYEIKLGLVKLVRELDKEPDKETISSTIKCLNEILKTYAGKGK